MQEIIYYTLNKSGICLTKNKISSLELNLINDKSKVKIGLSLDSLGGLFSVLSLSTEDDFTIENPYCSSCGRFDVNPIQEYKLTQEQVNLMSELQFQAISEVQYDKFVSLFL